MFHGNVSRCSTGGLHPAGAASGWEFGRAQLAHCRVTAANTAKPQRANGAIAESAAREFFQWCMRPAIAAPAIEAQRVFVSDQVGDGFDADRGVHRWSVRAVQVQGVSLRGSGVTTFSLQADVR